MRNAADIQQETPPPRFAEARNTRQKARASGMDPDRWYAVEYDKAIKNGEVREITFWNQSIAVFRGEDGVLGAVQNRCPHRHLKLSHGAVENCQLRCAYHGWSFNRDGWLTDYSHDTFGKSLIKHQLRTYPIQVLYGLIWIFPGDAELADTTQPPRIPELLRDDPWAGFTVDYTWKTHHSMVIDNICDFAHAFLHRKYQPFVDAKLKHYEADDKRVYMTYDTYMAEGKISRYFVNRKRVNTRSIEICYEYPYQWSNTGDSIKHYCFLLPIDERTTRVFFVFYRHERAEMADPTDSGRLGALAVQTLAGGGWRGAGSRADWLRNPLGCPADRTEPRGAHAAETDRAEMAGVPGARDAPGPAHGQSECRLIHPSAGDRLTH